MVHVFCTSTQSALNLCKVSWKYLRQYQSYGADMNDGSADGQTGADKNDGTTNRIVARHKNDNIFLILYKNICSGYSLEVPLCGASNMYQQHTSTMEK